MFRTKNATVLVVAAATITGGALWQWLSEDPQPVIPKVEVVKEYVIAPAQTPDPSYEPAKTQAAPAAPAPLKLPAATVGFGRKLLETKDVKAFVIEALKHPESGGAFYAALALRECSSAGIVDMKEVADTTIQKVVAAETTITQARMSAINTQLTRCAGFSEGEVTALRLEAARHALDGSDPFAAMAVSIVKTRLGTPERDKALEAIFTSGSPALISETFVPARLLQAAYTTDERGALVMHFNGQTYTSEADQKAVDVGAQLSACADGDYCELNRRMHGECVVNGVCYATREEFVRQALFKGDQAAFDKAAKIGDQIRSAIARGDRSIFH